MNHASPPVALIGRSPEQAVLAGALARVREGRGGVLLIEGEAGIGKTRLIEAALLAAEVEALRSPARATQTAVPFAPLLALLPNPGVASSSVQAAPEVQRALRGALLARGETVIVLEDLQWADHATLGLLPSLAGWLRGRPVLLIGSSRSEGLTRQHPLRHALQELRRAGGVEELSLAPLSLNETAALAGVLAGGPLDPAAAVSLQERSEGVPLYVQELTRALLDDGRLVPGPGGALVLSAGQDVPVPPGLLDVLLLDLEGYPPAVRAAADLAAVLGHSFDAGRLLGLLEDRQDSADQTFDALTETGLLREQQGRVSFRRRLLWEAVYAGIPWARRCGLHRRVAAALEADSPGESAEHWLAGQERERARHAFLAAADASCRQHAYREAAAAARRALELWPPGAEPQRRLEVLDQLGHCAQACGLLAEASLAWREAAWARREADDLAGLAASQRHLAGSLELQGLWEQALEARGAAADAYGAAGQYGAAAEERLAVGSFLRSASRPSAALEVLARALDDARRSGRRDLEARVLGLEGNARARMGEAQRGLSEAREGLAIALAGHFTGATVDVLHRVADTLEHLGDYAGARAAYAEALGLCAADDTAAAFACRACATVPLYQNGAWNRAAAECRAVLASASAPPAPRAVAGAMLGTVLAHRDQLARARPVLAEALALSRQIGLVPAQLRALWGLALAEEAAGRTEAATAWARALLALWQGVEDHYHVLFPLRWAASFFAEQGSGDDLRRATDALGRAADLNGGVVASSALAHALGELAWTEGHPELASGQFRVSAELLRDSDTPFEEASTRFRAGQLQASLGRREAAVAELWAVYRAARSLNAVLLTRRAAQALADLGEGVDVSSPGFSGLGLTRRQLEVLRLVALGRSDKAIAQALRLSPRTVEMHVGRLLASLGSRSRTEAVGRAAELGLLSGAGLQGTER